MDCGDAGHILLSRHVAEDLEHYAHWKPLLHELGPCEVKHGVRVDLFSLYSDEVGNSKLPGKLQAARKHRTHVRWAAMAAALLVIGAILGGAFFFLRRPASAIIEKSIAVLPLVNSTGDQANEYFSDGMSENLFLPSRVCRSSRSSGAPPPFSSKARPTTARQLAKSLAFIICSKAAYVSQPIGCASRWR